MRLRTLLALLICSLLVLTAGSIGWLGYSSSHNEAKRSTEREIALANSFAAHHAMDFLDEPANRLLNELSRRAQRGMLKLSDDHALGFDFAERMRVNPTLAWISYSDAATGHFVGVWRTADNDIVLNVQTPGQGEAHEETIGLDGTTTPYQRPRPKDYDPRTYDWYKNAVRTNTIVWSPPYLFVDKVAGITASKAWRPDDGGAPAGVFTVDFYLKDLEGLLDGVAKDLQGFSAILAPDGQLICTSQQADTPALVSALSAWVKAHPDFKNANGQPNSPLILIKAGGTSYFAALEHPAARSGLKCVVAGMEPSAVVFHHIDHATGQMGEVVLVALVLAVLAGVLMAYRISAPLHALGDDLANVGRFQLAGGNKPRSVVREVNQLHDAADLMKSGLRSFVKYVPDDVVRQLLSSGKEATLGGEMRRLTIFLSDIEGFTTHSEKVAPDALVHDLADYFEILSRQLRNHFGTLDKFIGDGLLGFFNAPEYVSNHENLACKAALMALEELAVWQQNPHAASFRTRVGLHCGDVLVGNMGTSKHLTYTVLGDVVNVTSRLENLNKVYGTQILVSGDVREHAGNDFEWRRLDRVCVAGRTGSMEIYELIGFKDQAGETRRRDRDLYEAALAHYFARDFSAARKIFSALAQTDPGNKAAILMTTRCDLLLQSELPADWSGVFAYEFK